MAPSQPDRPARSSTSSPIHLVPVRQALRRHATDRDPRSRRLPRPTRPPSPGWCLPSNLLWVPAWSPTERSPSAPRSCSTTGGGRAGSFRSLCEHSSRRTRERPCSWAMSIRVSPRSGRRRRAGAAAVRGPPSRHGRCRRASSAGSRSVASSGCRWAPLPSAPLANAVLDARRSRDPGRGVVHLRWVDDVVAVCADASAAIRARDAFQRALARDGAAGQPSKTTIMADRDRGGTPAAGRPAAPHRRAR